MPGPGEILGRWAATKITDYISEWKKNRKNRSKNSYQKEVPYTNLREFRYTKDASYSKDDSLSKQIKEK